MLIRNIVRHAMPRSFSSRRVLFGPLAGKRLVTSWRDYPSALMGYAETELTKWLMRNVAAGETWLDVGAHYGYTSLAMCERTGSSGRVFAFEPNLASAGCIARTRTANRFWWWTICPFGLSNSPSLAVSELPSIRGMIDSQVSPASADGTERFFTVGLDSVWAGMSGGNARVHGVKIDVQGMENETLAGMHQLLSAHRPVLVLEIHRGVDRKRTLQLLASAGYATAPEPIESGGTPFLDPESNYSFVFRAAKRT